MLESLFFYGFLLLVMYVIYWSVKNDNGPSQTDGKARKGKFTMKDARARRHTSDDHNGKPAPDGRD